MTTGPNQPATPTPPDKNGGGGPSVRDTLATAGKAAKGAFSLGRMMVKPFLPKKWTPKSIAITAGVVLLLLLVLYSVVATFIQTFLWVFQILLVGGLVVGGLYLLLAKR